LKRILIFDLDGTLVDSMGPLTDQFCALLRERCGVPEELSRPIYVALAGKGPRPQFEAVLRQVEALDDALLDQLTDEYWRVIETFEPALFPETLDVLSELRGAGHTLIVSSGARTESVLRKTRLTGMDRLLRLSLGTDEGGQRMAKGPGHFELIRESLSLRPEELRSQGAFVGDAIYDMQVGRNAGVLTIGRVTDGNAATLREAGAQYVIESLEELRGLFEAS
jgi:phosphoglycolate phosphatase-like HAD superfamily hydrolase